jgi:tRNA pseudouridine55 synthase
LKKDNYDFLAGEVLLLDKPLHWTSFDLVRKIRAIIRRKLEIKKIKVGHAGTLDPLATGLLIICTGKKTKDIEQIASAQKEYIADIEFGATTPSYDKETQIDKTYAFDYITKEDILQILEQKFKGEIWQYPPAFSAKKVDGKRAYDIARKGETPDLKPVLITILETEILSFELPLLKLRVKTSKGTYIRSMAHDLGQTLNSGAHLVGLQRTSIGDYKLSDAMSITEFKEIIGDDAINE